MKETGPSVSTMPSESGKLEQLISTGTLVNVYLKNGIRLQGHVLGFDAHTVLFRFAQSTPADCPLVYKRFISNILPHKGD